MISRYVIINLCCSFCSCPLQKKAASKELDANLKVEVILKSMPDYFDNLTTALETTREDKDLTMELVKGKLLDKAQKIMENTRHGDGDGTDKKTISFGSQAMSSSTVR